VDSRWVRSVDSALRPPPRAGNLHPCDSTYRRPGSPVAPSSWPLENVPARSGGTACGLCTGDELLRVLGDCHGWPGIVKARGVVRFADDRAESPLESISRVALARRGLPTPELQVEIGFDRVDFFWPPWNVVGEADGLEKYTGITSIVREKEREERLRAYGCHLVRWLWAEAYGRPDVLGDRVWVVLERAGWHP